MWINPSWSREVRTNDSKTAILLDRQNETGFSPNGYIYFYCKKAGGHWGYDKPPIFLLLVAKIKIKGVETSFLLTSNMLNKTLSYKEIPITFNHHGKILNDIDKEIGYSSNFEVNGYIFQFYVGLRGTRFSENVKIKTTITTPVDLENIKLDYIFIKNPISQTVEAKRFKHIAVSEITEEIDPKTNLKKAIPHFISLSETEDKSDLNLTDCAFMDNSNWSFSFFNFGDVLKKAKSRAIKVERTAPNNDFGLILSFDFGSLNTEESLEIDPTWTSPSSVHSSADGWSLGDTWENPTYAIDGNLDTAATSAGNGAEDGYPYIIFDLGSQKTIDKIRIYGYPPEFPWTIYTTNNTGNWGSSKGSISFSGPPWDPTWFELDITDSNDRYVVVERQSYTGEMFMREVEYLEAAPPPVKKVAILDTTSKYW